MVELVSEAAEDAPSAKREELLQKWGIPATLDTRGPRPEPRFAWAELAAQINPYAVLVKQYIQTGRIKGMDFAKQFDSLWETAAATANRSDRLNRVQHRTALEHLDRLLSSSENAEERSHFLTSLQSNDLRHAIYDYRTEMKLHAVGISTVG